MSNKYNGIIADGAIRSGKTIAMSLGFVLWAMSEFDGQNFAICGKTIGAAERNVISLLKKSLPGRGFMLTENRTKNLIIITKNSRKNYFYIFGGRDERSQDAIQGITLAGAYFDEAALMPESFVAQATARCSVQGSKWWFCCNPAGPYHWLKTGWIEKRDAKSILYVRFTMEDNKSLSLKIKERYKSMYEGVFYKRYILGEWCAAEGVIYPMFSEDIHVKEKEFEYDRYIMSCDYGTQNPLAVGVIGVKNEKYHLIEEYYHDGRKDGQMTDSAYADKLENIFEKLKNETKFNKSIIIDPSAASFIAELRKRGWNVIKARNSVLEGINKMAQIITENRLFIDPECRHTLREFSSYVWDESAVERGEDKPLKQNDHTMDMLRYALFTDLHKVNNRIERFSGKGVR